MTQSLICIKLKTGLELIGTSSSKHDDKYINIEDVYVIESSMTKQNSVLFYLVPFMPYSAEKLFTFKSKDIMVFTTPSKTLVDYYLASGETYSDYDGELESITDIFKGKKFH